MPINKRKPRSDPVSGSLCGETARMDSNATLGAMAVDRYAWNSGGNVEYSLDESVGVFQADSKILVLTADECVHQH